MGAAWVLTEGRTPAKPVGDVNQSPVEERMARRGACGRLAAGLTCCRPAGQPPPLACGVAAAAAGAIRGAAAFGAPHGRHGATAMGAAAAAAAARVRHSMTPCAAAVYRTPLASSTSWHAALTHAAARLRAAAPSLVVAACGAAAAAAAAHRLAAHAWQPA